MSNVPPKYTVGISTGDVNGVGLEVILKTFADTRVMERITPVLYGSGKLVAAYRKALNLPAVNFTNQKSLDRLQAHSLNVLNIFEEDVPLQLGATNEIGGKYAFLSLQAAARDLVDRRIDALVTAPINKKNIQSPDFQFHGHTEYIASLTKAEPLMILVGGDLRVATVTTHVPISEVAGLIKRETIEKKLNLLEASLRRDFGIDKPRIAVIGLNPHAGDDGLIGTEDQNEIVPAIKNARQKGWLVYGPYAADGFFGSGQQAKFDAVLAMYHDQGLVPFKALSFGSGTNYTAGLPVVRTSPDHGTGFDIAGKNTADESSFRQAVYTAIDVLDHRVGYEDRHSNPLERRPAPARERG
ncbi:MAG TPA: 4-hydroxythreonine-4-phosphate dehydrogenase PdxA [Chitinophagales bacterium]|nr:4-hydroxythreonine-4-phosphate dehydrogenase PdxA [Chitinophagales bacterium]